MKHRNDLSDISVRCQFVTLQRPYSTAEVPNRKPAEEEPPISPCLREVAHGLPGPKLNRFDTKNEEYQSSEQDAGSSMPSSTKPIRSSPQSKWLYSFQPTSAGSRKSDLSFLNPLQVRDGKKNLLRPTMTGPLPHRAERGKLLKTLREYITKVGYPDLDDPMKKEGSIKEYLQQFSFADVEVIKEYGYVPEDMALWAWITAATNPDQGALRFKSVTKECLSQLRRPPPTFLLTQILRADRLSNLSLRRLLQHSQLRVPTGAKSKVNMAYMVWDLSTALILLVRLFRHARKTNPGIYPEIATLACSLLQRHKAEEQCQITQLQFLCRSYNKLLALVALPPNVQPYLSVELRQQAQVILVRQMKEFKPRLPISREGFRALWTVALAQKKTDDEEEWARVKSESWPPWRKPKLGIDDDTVYPGEESQASRILSQMVRAGYSPSHWDRAAAVLTGWDTDRSPTIQTRTTSPRVPSFSDKSEPSDITFPTDAGHQLWSARVQATRTVREAWGCFLSYKKSPFSNHHLEKYNVHLAMLQKLVARTQQSYRILPGDGRETYPEPKSPRSYLFLPSDPPTVTDFYKQMLADGLKPGGRILALLLDAASDLENGLMYIKDSSLGDVQKDVLLSSEKYSPSQITQVLSDLPPYLLASFLRFLLFTSADGFSIFQMPSSSTGTTSLAEPMQIGPVKYAQELFALSGTRYLPAWNAIFAEANRAVRGSVGTKYRRQQIVRGWKTFRSLLYRMEAISLQPNFPILLQVLHHVEAMILHPDPVHEDDALVHSKLLFERIAYGGPTKWSWLSLENELPLLEVPFPMILLKMVGICGTMQDFDGLLTLLRWMKKVEPSLGTLRCQQNNGNRLMQDTLTLLRIFLEGRIEHDSPDQNNHIIAANRNHIEEAQSLIDTVDTWTGWPSDDQVSELLARWETWFERVEQARRIRLGRFKSREAAASESSTPRNPDPT